MKYTNDFSSFFCKMVIEYYLSMKPEEMELVSTIAQNLDCSDWTIRKFINSINNQKNPEGGFDNLYKLILKHTKFKKTDIEGSHYLNQQEYFEQLEQIKSRKEKSKQIALSLYKRQQIKKGEL